MGHKRTIKPNAKRLSALFMSRDKMNWDTFARKVKSAQRGFMGEPDEMRPGKGDFQEFPAACICKRQLKQSLNGTAESLHRNNKTMARLGPPTDLNNDEFIQRL